MLHGFDFGGLVVFRGVLINPLSLVAVVGVVVAVVLVGVVVAVVGVVVAVVVVGVVVAVVVLDPAVPLSFPGSVAQITLSFWTHENVIF